MSASSCDSRRGDGAQGIEAGRGALTVTLSLSERFATSCARLVNRRIAESTPARREARALEGRSMAVAIAGLELELYCAVSDGELELAVGGDREPDVRLRATPLELVRLARARSGDELKRARARLEGDVHVAEGFAELARHARPDLEDELARWVGDIAAHEAAELGRRAARFLARAQRALELDTGEYLTEEQRLVAGSLEVETFNADVDRLRDDVERAAARVERLASRMTGARR